MIVCLGCIVCACVHVGGRKLITSLNKASRNEVQVRFQKEQQVAMGGRAV